MKLKSLIIIIFSLLFFTKINAQEINASVEVMSDRVQNVDKKVFSSLKTKLEEFINTRRWTNDMFQPKEKIQCNFFINVSEPIGEITNNTFKATITVTSSRPVYNTDYSTPTFNFLDKDVVFKFDPSLVIAFDDNRVVATDAMSSNLSAIVAYYVYMVLGFDYDSFSKFGGNPYFKKAQNIVNNAPEDTKLIVGWKPSDNNKRNRYWLVDQVLNPRFEDLRVFWYNYHRLCLDDMTNNQENALKSIAPLFKSILQINNENPSAIYTQIIFNTKSNEIINLVSLFPPKEKQEAIDDLTKVDISNANKYRKIK